MAPVFRVSCLHVVIPKSKNIAPSSKNYITQGLGIFKEDQSSSDKAGEPIAAVRRCHRLSFHSKKNRKIGPSSCSRAEGHSSIKVRQTTKGFLRGLNGIRWHSRPIPQMHHCYAGKRRGLELRKTQKKFVFAWICSNLSSTMLTVMDRSPMALQQLDGPSGIHEK